MSLAETGGAQSGNPSCSWRVGARYSDFRKLFAGNSISVLGSNVTTVALPLTAVLYLHASASQMDLLGAAALVVHGLRAVFGQRIMRAVTVAAQILRGTGPSLYGVSRQRLRQTLMAADTLARANASWRFLVFGTQVFGYFLAAT